MLFILLFHRTHWHGAAVLRVRLKCILYNLHAGRIRLICRCNDYAKKMFMEQHLISGQSYPRCERKNQQCSKNKILGIVKFIELSTRKMCFIALLDDYATMVIWFAYGRIKKAHLVTKQYYWFIVRSIKLDYGFEGSVNKPSRWFC